VETNPLSIFMNISDINRGHRKGLHKCLKHLCILGVIASQFTTALQANALLGFGFT